MLGSSGRQGQVAGKAWWQARRQGLVTGTCGRQGLGPGGRQGRVAGRASGEAGTPWWLAGQEAQPDKRQMARYEQSLVAGRTCKWPGMEGA